MTILAEGDLQITLPAAVVGRKFDDETTHGLSHCMKAVDFIIELQDPENPKSHAGDKANFIQKFLSGQLDTDLKTKYRDSWLYEWAQGRIKKPITYLVLLGISTLSEADLLARIDALKRQIPVTGPGDQPWKQPFIAECAVLNLAAWNKVLPQFSVNRIGL